jgi:TonB family protein
VKYLSIIALLFVMLLLVRHADLSYFVNGMAKEPAARCAQKPKSEPKPNPLTLYLKIGEDRKILLNREEAGTLDDPEPLTMRLRNLFAERVRQRAFKEGMETRTDLPPVERIEKSIYVSAHPSLKADEVNRVVDEIKDAGANPVIILTEKEFEEKFGWLEIRPSAPAPRRPISGTFRGGLLHAGVLNGMAINLPKPPYPAVARSAHVSGSVRVSVLIDENGNVISATAVSGHPFLRAASVEAARGARFGPTLHGGKPVKVSGVLVYNFVGK